MEAYTVIIFFLILGFLVAGGAILTGKLLSPKSPKTDYQSETYECGIESSGRSHVQFRVGYYLFALLFLVFDIETLFLFPAASIFREALQGSLAGISGLVLAIELGAFLIILLAGLGYAWKKGALKWD